MTLTKHLEPLLDKTPLAIERIKLAWPGLSVSDRSYLLAMLLEHKTILWTHHRKQLIDLALADDNAYIRYLAAKEVSAPISLIDNDNSSTYLNDVARFKKIKSDPVGLVRLANEEEWGWDFNAELEDTELFWKLPQIERLVLVNGVQERGDQIAELLRYAAKRMSEQPNAVTLEEMFDVLLQYLGGKTIVERVANSENYALRTGDGFAEYSMGRSIKALWEVIPDIHKALSNVLIERLPEEAGFMSGIPPHVIDSLNEFQLEMLLWRNDITLQELRRKLYKESTNDSLRKAAISRRFILLDSDISEIVYTLGDPPELGMKKIEELAMLAENCPSATLVQMEAICDYIDQAPETFKKSSYWEAIKCGWDHQTERAKQLSPSDLKYEVVAMRVFALAKLLAPLKYDVKPVDIPENLKQHQAKVILQNPWQTYFNLIEVVRLDWREYDNYLPISNFDLPDDHYEESDVDRRQLVELIQGVQEHIKEDSEQYGAKLSAMSKALSMLSSQLENVETVTRQVWVIQSQIEKLANTVNILLGLAGAILLFVFFK